ncbi:MAG: hypothetical protein KJZ75_11170 [Hyphomonadaceae bacterium]|nr:hypothetical protein [Hyphomonadaceae bacterium]
MLQFDLPAGLDTQAQSEAGVTFPLMDINTGEQAAMDGVKMTLTLKGADSAAWANAAIEIERRNRLKLAAGEKIDEVGDMCEQLAAVTTAWTGFRTLDKKDAPCTPDNVAAAYRIAPAIRAQAYARATNRANFTRRSQDA